MIKQEGLGEGLQVSSELALARQGTLVIRKQYPHFLS